MQLYDWETLEKEELSSTFARQVIHADTLTVARVFLKKGCKVPEHSHHNEQISIIEKGSLRFALEGKEQLVRCAHDT